MSNIELNKINIEAFNSLEELIALTQPVSSIAQAGANAMYGLNHKKIANILPENRDSDGYVFFTRPQLNLRYHNILNMRKFMSLLTKEENSVQRYVRCMLDPRLVKDGITCPLVDNQLAFIPILTNTLKTLSGWPDIVAPTFASKAGVRKEQYVQVDGTTDLYESFDIDCNFRNIKDKPIVLMRQVWLFYMAAVHEGVMSPYMDFITENELDYNTRIYKIIMDETNTIVSEIAATGASFPISVPTGKQFDHDASKKYNSQTKDINIRFKSLGAIYSDDILIYEFNETSVIFNSEIRKIINSGFQVNNSHGYEKIPPNIASSLNFRGTPLINTETFALEWWISKSSLDWKNVMKKLNVT